MSNIDKSDSNNGVNTRTGIIAFQVTENMKNIGIKDFILNGFDFEITFMTGRKCCILFSPKKASISEYSKSIEKKLLHELDDSKNNNSKSFRLAIADIENQLIEYRNKIFASSTHDDDSGKTSTISTYNQNTQKILEQIKTLRQQVKESIVTADQWHTKLIEKYDRLRKLTLQLLPELWLPLEFIISAKSILNIKDWTLPFMAVILAPPSSMKTVALDMLIDYPYTFTTDEFTPGAFVSHNSSKSEEELCKDDMLPKLVDNLCIFPELAPLFTAKDEDLQRNFGKILRILDGKGFQSDSGAQGHRGYSGDMMLIILGAAVEIQYRVYKMFGNLGQKIYYLRLPRIEKSREERKEAAKQKNDFKDTVRQIKEVLFDYLMWFDAAPDCGAGDIDSKSGLVKIEWDNKREDENESDIAIGHIVDLGELIAHLRGVVGTFESSHTNRRIYNNNSQQNEQYSNSNSVNTTPTSPNNLRSIDFENDLPIIEESSRAIMHLKSLAMGHAISKGRNYITSEDIPIVIKLVLSTASIARVRIFDLLLENKGELTTSKIVKELRISHHTAHRTMTELDALELVDKTAVSTYTNAEYKIKLKEKFNWFTSDQFEKLREGFRPADYNKLKYRINITESSTEPNKEEQQRNFECDKKGACDSHTLALFSPSGRGIYNRNNSTNEVLNAVNNCSSNHTNESQLTRSNDIYNNNEDNGIQSKSLREQSNSIFAVKLDNSLFTDTAKQKGTNQQKNNNDEDSLRDAKNFKHVTQTQSHGEGSFFMLSPITIPPAQPSPEEKAVLEAILNEIKLANSNHVAVNAIINSVYSKNEYVKSYLGDKLTSRENRKVRDLHLRIIRHRNIEPIKWRPQLIVRWSSSSLQTKPLSHDQPPKQNHEDEDEGATTQ